MNQINQCEISEGAVGVPLYLELRSCLTRAYVSASGATSVKFLLTSPSGIVKEFDGTTATIGTASKVVLAYTTASEDDLDETGCWKYRAEYTKSGFTGQTTDAEFEVFAKLEAD